MVLLLLILIFIFAWIGYFQPSMIWRRHHRKLVIIGPGNVRTLLFHNLALGSDVPHSRCRRVVKSAISSKYEISSSKLDLIVYNVHDYSKIPSLVLKSMNFLIFAIDEYARGKFARSLFLEELTNALQFVLSTRTRVKLLILSKSPEFEMIEEDIHTFCQLLLEKGSKESQQYGVDLLSCLREVDVMSFNLNVLESNQLIIDWVMNS